MIETPSNIGKKTGDDGRFQPGNPGGPGRPAGSRNRATVVLDKLAEDDAKDILQKQIEMAKGGDQAAAALILSRVWPPRKGRPIDGLSLPSIQTAADIVAALGAVADATVNGTLTPDEASAVANVLEIKRKTIETTDVLARIEALERRR
jgi:hypothetical protein